MAVLAMYMSAKRRIVYLLIASILEVSVLVSKYIVTEGISKTSTHRIHILNVYANIEIAL